MAHWTIWMIVGVGLLGVEILAGTFYLLWIACACLLAGLVAIFTPLWWIPWLVFAVSAVLLVILTRPLARSLHGRVTQPSNVDALIGSVGVVIETLDPLRDVGRVRVGSEQWRARSEEQIHQGAQIRVLRVEGTTLVVEPAADQE